MNKIKFKKLKAFTLVELIIVITILAILATIAFVSFQNYTKDSRDSVRMTSLKNIESGLQAFQINTGNYPEPENYTLIQASGATVSYQGYIGDTISKQIKINKTPLDPFDQNKYVYSSNAQKTKYELLTHLENQNQVSYTNPTFAADYSLRTPKVIGNSIGVLLDTFNAPVSGNTIDILKANSGSTYKAYFSSNPLVASGKILVTTFATTNKTLANLDDGLIGYWDMETTTQSGEYIVLKDLSQYGNNGACYNSGVMISCGSQSGPQFVDGNGTTGKSMYFDGDDSILTTDINNIFSSISYTGSNITMIAKYFTKGLKDDGFGCEMGFGPPPLFSTYRYNLNDAYGYFLGLSSTGTNIFNQSVEPNYIGNLNIKNWRNTSFVKNINSSKLFLDGNLITSNTVLDTVTSPYAFAGPYIGATHHCSGYLTYMIGYIDEIRIYNRILSDDEIKQIYNSMK